MLSAPAEIDATTASQLRAVLVRAAGTRHPVTVVDLTGTFFCDSAGLQALIAGYRRARAEGVELRLVIAAGGAVSRVFALSGIDQVLPCFATLDEALARAALRSLSTVACEPAACEDGPS